MNSNNTHPKASFPSVAITRIALVVLVPLAVIAGARAISWAVSLKAWNSGDTLTAADLNENFETVKVELEAIQATTCGDRTRMIAGASACKAMHPDAATFVACGANGQYAADVCDAKVPSSTVLEWWQFNFQKCDDPAHPCVEFALSGTHGTSTEIIGTDGAIVCCRY